MSLIPPIRFSASKRRTYVIAIILLLGEIMPTYSCYILKGLVYIAIIAPLSCQSSFYIKYTKLNIYLFCDIRLISNAKYIYLIYS